MTFAEFLNTVPGIILVQGIGFVAMAFASFSYQLKSRSLTLVFLAIASIFWATQLWLLAAWTGVIVNVINIFRGFLLAGKEKYKWIASKATLFGIIGVFAISGIVCFYLDGALSLLPTATSIIQTYGLYSSDKRKLRFISMGCSVCWITYNSIVHSFAGVLCESLNIFSILIYFWRFRSGEMSAATGEEPLANETDSGLPSSAEVQD